MNRVGSFWTKVLYALVAFMLLTLFFLPDADSSASLSLIHDYKFLKVGIGLLCVAAAAVPLFIISSFATKSAINNNMALSLFLIIVFASSGALYLSYTHLSLILFAWGEYFYLRDSNFKASLCQTVAAIFVPQTMWAIPLMLVVNTVGKQDVIRTVIVNLFGALIPVLYLLVYRHVLYKDAVEYILQFWDNMLSISSPVLSLSFIEIFLAVILAIMLVRSFMHILTGYSKYNIVTEGVIKRELIISIIFLSIYILFWGNSELSLNIIFAFPASIVLCALLTQSLSSPYSKIELILFICALILLRLDSFI